MAITLVQSRTAEASNYDSITLAYNSNVTSGNLLTCSGGVWNGSEISSIPHSDTVTTSYFTILGSTTPAGFALKPWTAYGMAAGSGANTVTINPQGGGRYSSHTIAEWSGVDSTPLDVDGGSSTGTSTTPSDGITTTAASTVVVATVTHGGSGSQSITEDTGGGWTKLGEIESTSNAPHNTQYQLFSSAGAKTASWTLGGTLGWSAMTVSFEETAAAATNVHRKLMLGVGI